MQKEVAPSTFLLQSGFWHGLPLPPSLLRKTIVTCISFLVIKVNGKGKFTMYVSYLVVVASCECQMLALCDRSNAANARLEYIYVYIIK